jgi:hypothetical protein
MSVALFVDAAINLVLGILLLVFPPAWVTWLGLPSSSTAFYPNILGGVLVGIAMALALEAVGGKARGNRGLGLLGAVIINLSGGAVLATWLVFGRMGLPARGVALLWGLVTILTAMSLVELLHLGRARDTPGPSPGSRTGTQR